MLPIPHELKGKYPALPTNAVYAAMEIATIRAISQIYSRPVVATIDDEGLNVFLFKDEGLNKLDIGKLRKRSKRRLLDEIEIELTRQQTIHEALMVNSLRGSVVTGRIERISRTNMEVVIEINDLFQPIIIHAECPLPQQPPHERQKYRSGQTRQFFIVSCLPVSNGKTSKVRVVASRMAREFPSRLLSELTGIDGIRCIKRIPGGYSRITTYTRIPKDAINAVGKELREHIDVICLTK